MKMNINKFSKKRNTNNNQYTKLNKQFLQDNKFCQARISPECTIYSSEVHHKYPGKNRDKYLLETNSFLAVCNHCHRMIHDKLSTEEAISLGLINKE